MKYVFLISFFAIVVLSCNPKVTNNNLSNEDSVIVQILDTAKTDTNQTEIIKNTQENKKLYKKEK